MEENTMSVKVISEQHKFVFDSNVVVNAIGRIGANNEDYADYTALQIFQNQCPHSQANVPAKFTVRADLEREINAVLKRKSLVVKGVISESHTVIFYDDVSGQQISFIFTGQPNMGVVNVQSNRGMSTVNVDIKNRKALISTAKTILGV